MPAQQFAVMGLGRFGSSVARTLVEMGHEVLGIDTSEERIQQLKDELTHVIQADATDPETLREIGITDFDVIIVAIGEDIQASIMVTLILKEQGAKQVIAKALNELHGKVLERVGADRVVYPERDMGERVAKSLAGLHILDYFELDPHTSIVEIVTPESLTGKTLRELDLRKEFGVNVVCVKRGGEMDLSPGADTIITQGDVLILSGRNEQLNKLERMQ